jgi:hypothetical protein
MFILNTVRVNMNMAIKLKVKRTESHGVRNCKWVKQPELQNGEISHQPEFFSHHSQPCDHVLQPLMVVFHPEWMT